MLAARNMGWIGLDIGAASVKAAQVVRKTEGYRIRSASIVPRRSRWKSEELLDDQPLSSADEICAAVDLCDLRGSAAAALLPRAKCDLVQLDAPAALRNGAPPDMSRSIELETQRPMRDRVFDAWATGLQPGRLNAVTAPRAWSEQVSADVAAGGLNCQLIDALPWALARAASLVESPQRPRTVAALDWGYGNSTMCLIRGGTPVLVRSLKACSFSDVLTEVAAGLRLDARDAELLLQQSGGRSSPAEDAALRRLLAELLAEPLAQLTKEIRRTLEYWQGMTRGELPEIVYLFGGGGALAGIGERLTTLLGAPVEAWRLPPEHRDAPLPPGPLLGAAIGLSVVAWGVE